MSIKRLSGAGLTTPKSNKLWDQTTFQSGMFAIATVALTSTQTSIVFSGIPSNYTHLQLRGIGRGNFTYSLPLDGTVYLNGDTTNANYYNHAMYGTGSGSGGTNAGATPELQNFFAGANQTTNVFGSIVMDILDYSNTGKNTTIRYCGGVDNNGSGQITFGSVLWNNTAAVTSVSMYVDGSWIAGTHLALYGIKSA
jgi:hypothetical protein